MLFRKDPRKQLGFGRNTLGQQDKDRVGGDPVSGCGVKRRFQDRICHQAVAERRIADGGGLDPSARIRHAGLQRLPLLQRCKGLDREADLIKAKHCQFHAVTQGGRLGQFLPQLFQRCHRPCKTGRLHGRVYAGYQLHVMSFGLHQSPLRSSFFSASRRRLRSARNALCSCSS